MTALYNPGLQPELEKIFKDFHMHPELSGQEFKTTEKLRKLLEEIPGITVKDLGLPTGLYAVLNEGKPGPAAALRSDIDALAVCEESGVPYASVNEGVMHACGHDFHMTAVLGAAKILAGHADRLDGRVVFLFQAAEETGRGAYDVVSTGIFERENIREIYGLHVEPGVPSGTVGLRKGPFSAAVDGFEIRITGRGGHGAHPDQALDPVPAAVRLVSSIYEIRTRMLNPSHPAVISVTQINAGSSYNIIPDSAVIGGTFRTMEEEDRTFIRKAITAKAEAFRAEGYQTEVILREGNPASDNDPALIDRIAEIAGEMGIPVQPYGMDMAGEDFAFYQKVVPGALVQIGIGENVPSLHSPDFRADYAQLSMAANLLAAVVDESIGTVPIDSLPQRHRIR